jgi:hypothetical protein
MVAVNINTVIYLFLKFLQPHKLVFCTFRLHRMPRNIDMNVIFTPPEQPREFAQVYKT